MTHAGPRGLRFASGGVGEWLKPPVLKTGSRKARGFESRSLRQIAFAICHRDRASDSSPFGSESESRSLRHARDARGWRDRGSGVLAFGSDSESRSLRHVSN